MLDVSVVVSARNAARMLPACLESIKDAQPREILLVDGCSTDGTVEMATHYGARILSDGGRGLPVARALGAREAASPRVALIDADVVLPEGSLARLLDEFDSGGYQALQAGLHSISDGGYWGEALAHHHRTGRSRRWFGLVATIFDRSTLLELGFDDEFRSGEDIELRWRLAKSGAVVRVSEQTVVTHRFESSFGFARDQWLMDGRGLGRMVAKYGLRAIGLVLLPAAACVRGIALCLLRWEPRWIPYYLCFAAYNYLGMLGLKAGGS